MSDEEEIIYILRAVADRHVSDTDSSCPFCQAYGDEPHGMMVYDESHECIVLTAERLLAARTLKGEE